MTVTTIRVSAGLLYDDAGRVLLVRKHGTTAFMQPGGKPDDGEAPDAALVREVHEELGISVSPSDLVALGEFTAPAANEPDHVVAAHAFAVLLTPAQVELVAPASEIAEMLWVSVAQARSLPLAQLTAEHLLALLPVGSVSGSGSGSATWSGSGSVSTSEQGEHG